MSVHPTVAEVMWFAPPASSVHRHPSEKCGTYTLNERAHIASDLARNDAKNSGKLRAQEDQRALAQQIAQQSEVWL